LRYNLARRGYELIDIASGKVQRLIATGPEFDEMANGYNDLSPDGRMLALVRGAGSAERRDSGRTELRLFSVGGVEQGRLLHDWGNDKSRVQVFAWAPDQRYVWMWIIRRDSSQSALIASIDVNDGSSSSQEAGNAVSHAAAFLSPDGPSSPTTTPREKQGRRTSS
jgi:dipeptidyl aminopeptidase/acylaminoacyl peptidase